MNNKNTSDSANTCKTDSAPETFDLIHNYTSEQKLAWFGQGEWVKEPDEANFEYKGFRCRVIRLVAFEQNGSSFGGHFCGYVNIPKDHPWHGGKWDVIDVQVHGGITWAGPFPGQTEDLEEFWIGFDCAHSGDIVPSIGKVLNRLRQEDPVLKKFYESDQECRFLFQESYKNIQYAIDETQDLAQQAKEAYETISQSPG